MNDEMKKFHVQMDAIIEAHDIDDVHVRLSKSFLDAIVETEPEAPTLFFQCELDIHPVTDCETKSEPGGQMFNEALTESVDLSEKVEDK